MFTPFQATHPGTLLADELEARAITPEDFAMHIGISLEYLNDFLQGKCQIFPGMECLLEKSLGISAEYWLRFQHQYLSDIAIIKSLN